MLGRFTSRRPAVPEPVAPPEAPEPLPIEASPALVLDEPPAEVAAPNNPLLSDKLLDAKVRLHRRLIEEINLSALEKMPEEEVRQHVHTLVSQYTLAERLALHGEDRRREAGLHDRLLVGEVEDERLVDGVGHGGAGDADDRRRPRAGLDELERGEHLGGGARPAQDV